MFSRHHLWRFRQERRRLARLLGPPVREETSRRRGFRCASASWRLADGTTLTFGTEGFLIDSVTWADGWTHHVYRRGYYLETGSVRREWHSAMSNQPLHGGFRRLSLHNLRRELTAEVRRLAALHQHGARAA